MKKQKVPHGWYALVKKLDRHTVTLLTSNNYRKYHKIPLKRVATNGKFACFQYVRRMQHQ